MALVMKQLFTIPESSSYLVPCLPPAGANPSTSPQGAPFLRSFELWPPPRVAVFSSNWTCLNYTIVHNAHLVDNSWASPSIWPLSGARKRDPGMATHLLAWLQSPWTGLCHPHAAVSRLIAVDAWEKLQPFHRQDRVWEVVHDPS